MRLAKGEGVLVAADGTRCNNRAPVGRTDHNTAQTAVQLPIAVMARRGGEGVTGEREIVSVRL